MDLSDVPLLRDGVRVGTAHMQFDAQRAQAGRPLVRFFRWHPPAASLGWKQAMPEWLDAARVALARLDIVERPTGGGLAWHGSDVSCAVILPRGPSGRLHELMQAICETAAQACRAFGIAADVELEQQASGRVTVCLSEPSPYAVYAAGRKLAGFALRRYPQAWLIQGSLLVRPVAEELRAAMPPPVRAAWQARAISLCEAAGRPVEESEVIEAWAAHWGARRAPLEHSLMTA